MVLVSNSSILELNFDMKILRLSFCFISARDSLFDDCSIECVIEKIPTKDGFEFILHWFVNQIFW